MTSPSSSQHRYNRVLKSSTPTAPQASGEMDFSVPRAGPTDPFSSSPPTYQDSSYPQYTSYGSAVLTNDMNRNANWGEVSSAPHSGNSRTPPGLSGLGGFLRTNNLSQPTAPNSGAPNSGASHQSHNRNVEPVTSHLGGKFPSAPQPAGVSQPSSYGGPSRGTPSAHFTGGDIVSSLTNILQTPPTIIHAQSQSHGPAPPQAVGTGSNAAGLNLLAKLQGNAATIVTPSTSTRRIPAGMLQQPSAVSPPSILPMAPNMITKTANQQGTSTPASNVTPFTQANPNPTPSSTKTPSSAQTKNAASPSANQAKQAKQQQQQQQQQAVETEEAVVLVSKQVQIPPQHEVFVQFPNATVLANFMAKNPQQTPASASAGPVPKGSGYRLARKVPGGKPRLFVFGQLDPLPLGVAISGPDGVGMLFYNDDPTDEMLNATTGASSAAADNAKLDRPQFADIYFFAVVKVSPVRKIGTAAKDLHHYLNALRYDAVENQTRGPNVLIVGNTDTGKSTLANYLVCSHLREAMASVSRYRQEKSQAAAKRKAAIQAKAAGELGPEEPVSSYVNHSLPPQIQFIDVDIGQQGVSLPGCVSATNNIIGKAQLQSGLSVFYGDTSVYNEDDKTTYLNCVANLLTTVDTNMCVDRFETDLKRMGNYPTAIGRIVNTMGFTVGLGFEILIELVKLCKIDVVVVTGQNSELQFNLQDEIRKRYGHNKHYTMPTFVLYNAPDCPPTSRPIRKQKRDAKILDYFRSMRFGDAVPSNQIGIDSSPITASINSTPAASAASVATGSFGFPAQPAISFIPDATRQLIFSVPLSRLALLEAKDLKPIAGQGFNKLGTNKLAAIPVPTFNEIGGKQQGSLGFFPFLSIAADCNQLPNARGVLAFVGMLGLNRASNSLDLIIDPTFVEERSLLLEMLRGGDQFDPDVQTSKDAVATAIKYLMEGTERITLLVSNISLPDDTVHIVRD